MYKTIDETRQLLKRIKMSLFDKEFRVRCEVDDKHEDGRPY